MVTLSHYKNKRLVTFAVCVIVLFLSACNNDASPLIGSETQPVNSGVIGGSNNTMGETFQQPECFTRDLLPFALENIENLTSSGDEFKPTAIFFLLDVSKSMEDLCSERHLEAFAEIPHFIVSFIRAYHLDEHGRDDEIQIGWATYPTKNGETIQPQLHNLQWYSNNPGWYRNLKTSVSEFEPGLDHNKSVAKVISTLENTAPNHKKVVIVITDAFFTYNFQPDDSDVEEEKRYFRTELPNSLSDDTEIVILQLPCETEHPDLYDYDGDMAAWTSFDQESEQTSVLLNSSFSIKNAIEHLFGAPEASLRHLSPVTTINNGEQLNWGWIDNSEPWVHWSSPGDTAYLDLKIIASGSPGFEFCELQNGECRWKDPQLRTQLDNDLLFLSQAQPDIPQNCGPQEWLLNSSRDVADDFVGIYWWKSRPHTIDLTIVPADTFRFINQTHFDIQAKMNAGSSLDRCYEVRLYYQTGSQQTCILNAEVQDTVSWTVPYDPEHVGLEPLDIHISVYRKVMQPDQQEVVEKTSTQVVGEYFPEFFPTESGPISFMCRECPITDTIKITNTIEIEFNFRYASPLFYQHISEFKEMTPDIYALTETNYSEQDQTGICDGTNGGPLQRRDTVWISLSDKDLFGHHYGHQDDAVSEELKGELSQWEQPATDAYSSTILFTFPLSWRDSCMYTKILFEWPEPIRNNSWQNVICYLEGDVVCEPTTEYWVKGS